MPNIDKRIEALEQVASNREPMVVIVQFVGTGPNGPVYRDPIAYSKRSNQDSWRIERREGEPIDAFTKRAEAEVPWNGSSVVVLLEEYADERT